jgi:arabinofuranosyltransferase
MTSPVLDVTVVHPARTSFKGPATGPAGETSAVGASTPDLQRLLQTLAIAVFAIVVVRTAWLSDDAFITFRTVDNFVSGYGLRWNVAERVQTYTHPLWMLVVAAPYSITREAFFTPLAVSVGCSMLAVWLLLTRIAASTATASIAASALIFSKAFVDYSTSGLENPLTHLLLVLFVLAECRARSRPTGSPAASWLVCGLLMLNRLDAGLLVLPALARRARDDGWRATWRGAVRGMTPLAAWELFSIVYYGFPVPNTAYAKLPVNVQGSELAAQGMLYLLDSISQDPVTLLAIVGLGAATLVARPAAAAATAAGIALYIAYTVRVGGDFMSGRFLSAPLVLAVANFARVDWRMAAPTSAAAPAAIAAAFALLGIFATTRPPITSGEGTFIMAPEQGLGVGGVADERAFYYRYTGLLRWSRAQPLPYNAEVQWGREAAARREAVVVHPNIGLYGFHAGRDVHVVDPYGLGDALLARLPARPGWRVGHYERDVPAGYLESLRTGRNVIEDTAIAMRHERLTLVTRGPLWTRRRWRAIGALNLGG